jgi:hypothetical protein
MRAPAFRKISQLESDQPAQLLKLWTATLGRPPQFRASRELLAGTLAWHLQERKFGGLKPATVRKLRLMSRNAELKRRSHRPPTANVRPGTVIIKHWRGARHVVTILADGFEHQGKVFGSLSQLAREITGTRWNGPAFFGLRKRQQSAAEVRDDGR